MNLKSYVISMGIIVSVLSGCATPQPKVDYYKMSCSELKKRLDQMHQDTESAENLEATNQFFGALGALAGGTSNYDNTLSNQITNNKIEMIGLENAFYANNCHKCDTVPAIGSMPNNTGLASN